MATGSNDGFARDLGYLGPFLDKLEAHGRSLGGPAGDRLVALMREERLRWDEIAGILGGRAPAASGAAGKVAAVSPEARPVVSAGSFTVGSLRGSSGKRGES